MPFLVDNDNTQTIVLFSFFMLTCQGLFFVFNQIHLNGIHNNAIQHYGVEYWWLPFPSWSLLQSIQWEGNSILSSKPVPRNIRQQSWYEMVKFINYCRLPISDHASTSCRFPPKIEINSYPKNPVILRDRKSRKKTARHGFEPSTLSYLVAVRIAR